jgi:hypothetical protein
MVANRNDQDFQDSGVPSFSVFESPESELALKMVLFTTNSP